MISQNISVKVFIVICGVIVFCGNCANTLQENKQFSNIKNPKKTTMDKLKGDLLKNYNKETNPNQHYNQTNVTFGLNINHVEVIETTSTVNFYCWVRLVWNDNKLKWNPENYDGIKMLWLSPYELWKPDIFLLNSAVSAPLFWSTVLARATSDGQILWVPPSRFSVLCDLNLKYWPYDVQKCYLQFSTWTAFREEIDLQIYANHSQIDLSGMIVTTNQWHILDTNIVKGIYTYDTTAQEDVHLEYRVTLMRYSPSFKYLIMTPTFVVIVSTLLPFWLEPHGYLKIYIHSMTLLMICVLFSYFTQKISSVGDHTPHIVSFYSHCLYVVSLAMGESIAVIWMVSTSHNKPVPWRIKKYFYGKLGTISGFIPNTQIPTPINRREEEMRDHQVTEADNISDLHQILNSSEKYLIQEEWVSFAGAVDKLVFIFYCFLFLILGMAHYF